jgi:glyoxylase-like metal-dependent hydrolase (beta-lactamase superfamily II)
VLEIISLVLGPVQTNTYILANPENKLAVVIDPSWDGNSILEETRRRNWRVTNIWLTHAHFDHIGGAAALADGSSPMPPVALHPDDYPLWRMQGGAALFGLHIDPGPEPTIALTHGMLLHLGETLVEVRHAPGHTPGHVLFYCKEAKAAFCGDVIFQGSIGRTDLPGGDYETLINSIHQQVLSLPGETRLFSGHGPVTTVDEERRSNPFLV